MFVSFSEFANSVKRFGLRQSPCDIPISVVNSSDVSFPILTLSDTYWMSIFVMWSSAGVRIRPRSFRRVFLCTVWKALDISLLLTTISVFCNSGNTYLSGMY